MGYGNDSALSKVFWELNKLKGLLRSLKIIISEQNMKRHLLRSQLQEVVITLESLRTYLKRYIDEIQMNLFLSLMTQASKPQQSGVQSSFREMFQLSNLPKVPEDKIESLFSSLNATLMLIDHAKNLPDNYFREKVGKHNI